MLADRGRGGLGHTARDCTAHAELTGRELVVCRRDGHILLYVPDREVCLIAVSIISKITSTVSISPPLGNSFDVALDRRSSTSANGRGRVAQSISVSRVYPLTNRFAPG